MALIDDLRMNVKRLSVLPSAVTDYLREEMLSSSRHGETSLEYHGLTDGSEGVWADASLWKTDRLITLVKAHYEAQGFVCNEARGGPSYDVYHYLEISWKE